ncbi:MAG: TlpA family protein disulfide reductase, partial [Chloroflexi bacterium]|nr:TlpA family protein disulfide reductase [Chloroflexota bacterium]
MIAWTVLMIAIGVMGLVLVRSFAGPADAGPAPDFTLTTYSGETYSLDELEGQVIVLNFWASWCAPCAEEAPDLEATWQAYRDQGVV